MAKASPTQTWIVEEKVRTLASPASQPISAQPTFVTAAPWRDGASLLPAGAGARKHSDIRIVIPG